MSYGERWSLKESNAVETNYVIATTPKRASKTGERGLGAIIQGKLETTFLFNIEFIIS